MKTVMAMAASGIASPILPRSVESILRISSNYACWMSAARRARCRPRRTARPRLGRRRRLGDGEVIAGRVEGAQAGAVGRIAQPHAEHGLELVIARPNAPLVEGQQHGG